LFWRQPPLPPEPSGPAAIYELHRRPAALYDRGAPVAQRWVSHPGLPLLGGQTNRISSAREGVSSMALTETQIMDALRAIRLPAGVSQKGGDIVAAGMVSGLMLRDGHVGFAIEVDPTQAPVMEPIRKAAEKAIMDLPGVLSATVVLTAHRAAPQTAQRPSG